MYGAEAVIAVRQRGLKPAWLTLWDGILPRSAVTRFPAETAYPDVLIEPADRRLDLRFLVGLVVLINTESIERAKALEAMAKAAGASRVLTFTHGQKYWEGVIFATDTAGEKAEWPT